MGGYLLLHGVHDGGEGALGSAALILITHKVLFNQRTMQQAHTTATAEIRREFI